MHHHNQQPWNERGLWFVVYSDTFLWKWQQLIQSQKPVCLIGAHGPTFIPDMHLSVLVTYDPVADLPMFFPHTTVLQMVNQQAAILQKFLTQSKSLHCPFLVLLIHQLWRQNVQVITNTSHLIERSKVKNNDRQCHI